MTFFVIFQFLKNDKKILIQKKPIEENRNLYFNYEIIRLHLVKSKLSKLTERGFACDLY